MLSGIDGEEGSWSVSVRRRALGSKTAGDEGHRTRVGAAEESRAHDARDLCTVLDEFDGRVRDGAAISRSQTWDQKSENRAETERERPD